MLTLYPPIKPFADHKLRVDDIHTLYVEQSGDPYGIPVVFIHGGPGSGCATDHRRFFDPKRYHIILYDQRGCGHSTPHACIENNTTNDLIADLEKIREHLKVDKWMLFGGSWGSTLALLYAQAHPTRVLSMILRGVFLCRERDLNWFYREGGASRIYPEHWQDFVEQIPVEQHDDLISAYHELLTGDDDIVRMNMAKSWARWEAVCCTLELNPHMEKMFASPRLATSLSVIETHYFKNKCFIKENQILDNMHKIRNIPGIIVHGRYDMVCPLDNAFAVYKAWQEAELNIIRRAGHTAMEPAIVSALVHATNELAS